MLECVFDGTFMFRVPRSGRRLFYSHLKLEAQVGIGLNLIDSYWVSANPQVLARILLNGKEGTPGFPGSMPAIGMTLSDQQIAGVLTYIRNSWGLNAGAVSVEIVAKSRKDNKGRVADWTDMLLRSLEMGLAGRTR